VVKRFFAKKANKALFFNLLMGSASFAMLVMPVLAQASTLSFIGLLFNQTAVASAASIISNSQTMPLLAAAVNLDPQAAIGGGDITVVDGSALLPDQGPSGTVADILNQPANSQISVYTVREGDTLSGIAQMFDVSVNTIQWANDIQRGIITPGQTLIILPISGIQHTIVAGDTLASLASTYKSDAHDIASYNGLADNDSLTVGDSIIIPDGEVSAAASSGSGSSSSGAAKKSSTTSSSHAAKIKSIAKGSTTEPYLGGSGPALSGYFAWPLNGGVITQGLHGWNAVDIGAPRGTAIYAAAAGTVIVARTGGWNGGYGNYVVISHPNGTETLYAHMSKVIASAGEQVAQGDTIGLVGMTGLATGNHLHFEVRGAANPFASY
jgi:murein DD-endopeptidase MepM/ murein hydrolase activator NlpD